VTHELPAGRAYYRPLHMRQIRPGPSCDQQTGGTVPLAVADRSPVQCLRPRRRASRYGRTGARASHEAAPARSTSHGPSARTVGYVARFHGNRCAGGGNIAAVGAEILPKNHLGNGQWMPGHAGDTAQQRERLTLFHSDAPQFASVKDDHSTSLLMRRVLVERWRDRAGSGLSCGR
jgi:hypothetical protein